MKPTNNIQVWTLQKGLKAWAQLGSTWFIGQAKIELYIKFLNSKSNKSTLLSPY